MAGAFLNTPESTARHTACSSTAVPFDLQPTLESAALKLRPLTAEDFDALYTVASDPLIWEQHPEHTRHEEAVFRRFFADAMASGGALIVIDANSDEVIGSSRYNDYNEAASDIEIGWTFLARKYWGGETNGEMKRLMLDHAFQFVDSVIFMVGEDNQRSRRAVEKIGGILDGERKEPAGFTSVRYRLQREDYLPANGATVELTFALTEDEYFDFSNSIWKTTNRSSALLFIACFCLGLGIASAIFFILETAETQNFSTREWLLGPGLIFGFFLVYYLLAGYNRRDLCRPLTDGSILREQQFEFSAAGIDIAGEGYSSHYDWDRIVAFAKTDQQLLLFIDRIVAFVIPRRVFESTDASEAFYQQTKDWARAQSDDPNTFAERCFDEAASAADRKQHALLGWVALVAGVPLFVIAALVMINAIETHASAVALLIFFGLLLLSGFLVEVGIRLTRNKKTSTGNLITPLWSFVLSVFFTVLTFALLFAPGKSGTLSIMPSDVVGSFFMLLMAWFSSAPFRRWLRSRKALKEDKAP